MKSFFADGNENLNIRSRRRSLFRHLIDFIAAFSCRWFTAVANISCTDYDVAIVIVVVFAVDVVIVVDLVYDDTVAVAVVVVADANAVVVVIKPILISP